MKKIKNKHRHIFVLRYILFLYFAFTLVSCNQKFQFDAIEIEQDAHNVLRANVHVTTRTQSNAFIEFWENGTNKKQRTGISENKSTHDFTLIGFHANGQYTMQVTAYQDDLKNNIQSDEYSFSTGSLPEELPLYNKVTPGPDIFPGYILIRKVIYPSSNILLDNSGRIVWYEMMDTTLMNPFSWTDKNSILMLRHTDEILEIDLYGNVLFNLKYGEKGYDRHLHHEIRYDKNQNILALTREQKAFDLSSRGGLVQDTVKADGILVLNPEGEKIWSWSIFDVADPVKDTNIEKNKDDWSHANALYVDFDGNYLVSYHHFDQIWKINSTTGKLIWKLGINGDFKIDQEDWFYKQHAVHLSQAGNLMLFDNGDVIRKLSRAIAFNLDEEKMQSESTMSVFLPDSLFSFKQGSVYEIEDNQLLFCSSIKNRIIITDMSGNILWQVNGSDSNYRAYYIEDLPAEVFN